MVITCASGSGLVTPSTGALATVHELAATDRVSTHKETI